MLRWNWRDRAQVQVRAIRLSKEHPATVFIRLSLQAVFPLFLTPNFLLWSQSVSYWSISHVFAKGKSPPRHLQSLQALKYPQELGKEKCSYFVSPGWVEGWCVCFYSSGRRIQGAGTTGNEAIFILVLPATRTFSLIFFFFPPLPRPKEWKTDVHTEKNGFICPCPNEDSDVNVFFF